MTKGRCKDCGDCKVGVCSCGYDWGPKDKEFDLSNERVWSRALDGEYVWTEDKIKEFIKRQVDKINQEIKFIEEHKPPNSFPVLAILTAIKSNMLNDVGERLR